MSIAPSPAFNPNYLDEVTIIQALAEGSHAPVLQAYFGLSAYLELTKLAQQALTTPINPNAPYVYVLPGLLGSKLGRTHYHQTELIWLDPANVMKGQLMTLALQSHADIHTLGVMLPTCLKLALTLRCAGTSVKLYAYDWRCSLIELGQQLAQEILNNQEKNIQIVAHSMGGLVARAALKHQGMQKVSRVIQIGTPNHGSFALVQALRACYPTVRKLGALDRNHNAEQLTASVFSSFNSFYEMLPQPHFTPGINLYNQADWPVDALTPSSAQLKRGQLALHRLADADQRFHLIIGDGQPTVTGIYRKQNEFVFECSDRGDGTVPVELAQMDGICSWYIQEAHGHLPRNTIVCQSVIDLLTQNTTTLLRPQPVVKDTKTNEFTESDLKELSACKLRWDQLSLDERRNLLEPIISDEFKNACFAEPATSA
jgi:hypothetical protein